MKQLLHISTSERTGQNGERYWVVRTEDDLAFVTGAETKEFRGPDAKRDAMQYTAQLCNDTIEACDDV